MATTQRVFGHPIEELTWYEHLQAFLEKAESIGDAARALIIYINTAGLQKS